MPIHPGQGGVAAMIREASRHTPVSIQTLDGPGERLAVIVKGLVR